MSRLKPLFLIVLLFLSCPLLSQIERENAFDRIEFERKKVKRKFTKSPDILAKELTSDLTDDEVKVYAMCDWISHHIRYDLKGYIHKRIYAQNSQRVLKRKKALCGEYAQLLNEMCESVGISAETVSGYTLDYDYFPEDTLYRAEHAWSLVKVNAEWQLLDLTYGSGYIELRKQWFRQLLWKYANVPYLRKFKYVHEFNPAWFDVPPGELITSHYPVMPMNQLLSPPVTMDQFSQGRWPTDGTEELLGSFQLDTHHSSDQLTKWRTIGSEGNKSNPANNRVAGVYAFLIADSLFKKYYVPEGKMLSGSNDELLELDSLYAFADSCLLRSKQDNRTEYNTRTERSREWKRALKDKNRAHRSAISDRRRKNLKQISQMKRIERKLRSSKRYAGRAGRQTKAGRIERVPRPKKREREKRSLVDSLLTRIDSLHLLENRLLSVRDSMMTVYPETYQLEVIDLEKEIKRGHKINTRGLRSYLGTRKFYFPLIHINDTWIEKRWFETGHEALNQANLQMTDTLINALYKNLKAVTDTVKDYHGHVKQHLAFLKKIKRASFTDRQEVRRYIEMVEKHHTDLDQFQAHCQDYMHIHKKVKHTLYSSKGTFKKSRKILRRDDLMETVRYNHYRAEKRFIQRAEDRRIAALRLRLKEISLILKRTKTSRLAAETS